MSTVGLTKAETNGLQYIRGDHERIPTEATFGRLYDKGLCTPGGGQLTPRGHAALAAPRMTDCQFHCLQWIESGFAQSWRPHGQTINDCVSKGWLESGVWSLTPAGRTALNNVRAAMGSPDWKEGL